ERGFFDTLRQIDVQEKPRAILLRVADAALDDVIGCRRRGGGRGRPLWGSGGRRAGAVQSRGAERAREHGGAARPFAGGISGGGGGDEKVGGWGTGAGWRGGKDRFAAMPVRMERAPPTTPAARRSGSAMGFPEKRESSRRMSPPPCPPTAAGGVT